MIQNKTYLTNATALRGIAALLVVVFHGNEIIAPFIGTEATFWFRKLYLMVDLFFILSGFIMCYVYESFFLDSNQVNKIGVFLKARFARIYPLHFITLMVCVGCAGITYLIGKGEYLGVVDKAINDFSALPAQLLLLNSAHLDTVFKWNIPSWSISAEWIAYLIFPFLVKPFSKFNKVQTFLAIFFITLLYAGLVFWISPNKYILFPFLTAGRDLDLTYDWGFLRGILGFTLGMCVYRLYVTNFLKSKIGSDFFLLIIVAVYSIYSHFNFSDVLAPHFFALIVLSTVYGSNGMNRFYRNSILQKLGDWSFSIYMWHIVLFSVTMSIKIWIMNAPPVDGPPEPPNYFGLTSTVGILSIYFVATILLGALSFKYIERPCRIWINGLGKRA